MRVAGADRKLANARIAQHPQRALREYLRMALRVRNNLAIVIGGCQQVSVWKILFSQRTGALIKIRGSELDQFGQARLLTYLSDGPAH